MESNVLFLLSVLAILTAPSWSFRLGKADEDPFVEGPLRVNESAYYQAVNPSLEHNLNVYAPNEPGNFPVYYFITGFAGLAPGFIYSDMMTRIASHGIVAVGIWKEESPFNSFNVTWLADIIDFVENRLETSLHLQGFDRNMHVDYMRSFIGAHSAGGHVPIVQLGADCVHFMGQILLSPVDGAYPFDETTPYVITPGEKVNFTIPTVQIVNGFDPVISNVSGGACAPEEFSGHRFFDAMTGPSWYINTTDFGHADVLDEPYEQGNELVGFCVTDPTTDKQPYIYYVAGATVSFMKGVLDPVNGCHYFDNLEVSGILNINTENEYAANGWERCSPSLQCTNNPASN